MGGAGHTYINCYMKGMLSAWQANHDVQLVLEAYSCIVYICDYMMKSQEGISELLANACQKAKDDIVHAHQMTGSLLQRMMPHYKRCHLIVKT